MRQYVVRLGWCLGLCLGLFVGQLHASEKSKDISVATFGGGCFWCMEPPFDKLDGVLKTESGYSGGHVKNPTYKQVVRGNTGHVEVVQVSYDASVISYQELLAVYWRNVDPFDGGGQFCDRGYSYRPVIFVHDEEQAVEAKLSKEELNLENNKTPIEAFKNFYTAEKYHQNYYQKNPVRYKYYRYRCGRDQRLSDVWDSTDSN